jgi:DNA-binding NtrC family response regulator
MNAKILLVDDEPAVLAFLKAALERFHCQVIAAASAEDALEQIDQRIFDLVLTDFRLPGLKGDAVVRAARGRHNGTRVLLMTGFSDEMPEWMRSGPEAVRILGKPFTLLQLRREVEEALRITVSAPVPTGRSSLAPSAFLLPVAG